MKGRSGVLVVLLWFRGVEGLATLWCRVSLLVTLVPSYALVASLSLYLELRFSCVTLSLQPSAVTLCSLVRV